MKIYDFDDNETEVVKKIAEYIRLSWEKNNLNNISQAKINDILDETHILEKRRQLIIKFLKESIVFFQEITFSDFENKIDELINKRIKKSETNKLLQKYKTGEIPRSSLIKEYQKLLEKNIKYDDNIKIFKELMIEKNINYDKIEYLSEFLKILWNPLKDS